MSGEIACGECGAPMALRTSRYGPFYGCSTWPRCRGTHGAHADGRPLGIPADERTKRARMEAHAMFDRLWRGWGAPFRGKARRGGRSAAYRWMQEAMGLSPEEAHIARFDEARCAELMQKLKEGFPRLFSGEARR